MSVILQLPPITAMALTLVNNADFRDAIAFRTPDGTAALDITGIYFRSQIRLNAVDPNLAGGLDMDTTSGLMFNGGTTGLLSWKVPASRMKDIVPGSYVMDLVASQGPYTVNLMPSGPATVTIVQGITR